MPRSLLHSISLFLILGGIWGGYRYGVVLPEWIDELVVKPGVWIGLVLVFVWWGERTSVRSVLGERLWGWWQLGFGVGLGLLLGVALFALRGWPEWGEFETSFLALSVLISMITGLSEEIVFRGYILTRLQQGLGNRWWALGMSSVWFMLIHVPLIVFSLSESGSVAGAISFLYLLLMMGIVYGGVFLYTGSLMAAVVVHGLWNFWGVVVG